MLSVVKESKEGVAKVSAAPFFLCLRESGNERRTK